ncbi:uncharacterized protein LOC114657120 [Erpetoichthys calabaricus]|uniref:uncharacterized protein LOC114657120 n=1 Tax=Erpetoichthys calabaricus TaxID=27687 RepID=UPI00109EFE34|nr:uncharacterized protein LOC114657120 [Erpetoichthys calabaricus]
MSDENQKHNCLSQRFNMSEVSKQGCGVFKRRCPQWMLDTEHNCGYAVKKMYVKEKKGKAENKIIIVSSQNPHGSVLSTSKQIQISPTFSEEEESNSTFPLGDIKHFWGEFNSQNFRRSEIDDSTQTSPVPPYEGFSSRLVFEFSQIIQSQQFQLLEVIQQHLNSEEQSMQEQWKAWVDRVVELEQRASESSPSGQLSLRETSSPYGNQTLHLRKGSTPTQDSPPSLPINIMHLDGHPDLTVVDDGAASSTEVNLWPSNLPDDVNLLSSELHSLVRRASEFAGIVVSDGTGPEMVPEFESLVQSTWSNPASARPFRDVHSKLYLMSENQGHLYCQMPPLSMLVPSMFQTRELKDNDKSNKKFRGIENLAEKVYQTGAMLVRVTNYLRYLSDYQERLLCELTEETTVPRSQAILSELQLIGKFSFQLSCHQAELSGRAMAFSVAIRRQVWVHKTENKKQCKVTLADWPFMIDKEAVI